MTASTVISSSNDFNRVSEAAEMSSNDLVAPFTLYYAAYSICATMVRVTYALRGEPREGRPDMNVQLELIDISPENPEQLSDFYLCKVNPDGQVPVLANDKLLPKPMPESVDITWYICDWHPNLLPTEHEATIREMMKELHEINYGVLTFGSGSKHPLKLENKIQEILGRGNDISADYRSALEHKSRVLLSRQGTLSPTAVVEHESRTREFCTKVITIVEENGTTPKVAGGGDFQYIFGSKPTALDAHTLTFLRRVHDAGRDELIPSVLVEWAEKFSKGDLWNRVVANGTTLPPCVS